MQNTLLITIFGALGLGLLLALINLGKGREKPSFNRMPINLDFDAAKLREKNRH
ncbi:MAG: hypothetical protein V3573_14340 [Desulfovibrionaceae bacterium]